MAGDIILKDDGFGERALASYGEGINTFSVIPYESLGDYLRNAPAHIEQIRASNRVQRKLWEGLLGRVGYQEAVLKKSVVLCEIDDLVFEGLNGSPYNIMA